MVAWAAVIPALKAAAPWIAKIGGTALSFLGNNKLLGGSSNEPEGSGITYKPAVADSGMVPANNGGGLYSQIAGHNSGGGMGIMPPEGGQSLFDRLRRQY